MSGIGTPENKDSLNSIGEEFVRKEIKRTNTCGCPSCQGERQSWLDWLAEKIGVRSNHFTPLSPDSPHSSGPSHNDPNNDPPPSIDSGGLSEWYSRGL